ncbi:MAG TPA: hypothetical protein VHY91_08515 [Pirellulales bacterium]|nr:hypothetical protein [Pirellulales bacterium]
MKVTRLAEQSLDRWLERIGPPKAVSLVACAVALVAALAGCQSQQTNSGDPFLPFMRTRVPPPGTNVPADSYYQGAPATSAPPATMPPPAGAPAAMPSSMRSQPDKYAPPGGYNLPQSSIDRSKVNNPATGEVKAGGTAIARRSLAKPNHGQSTVDTQLTADKVTAPTAAAAAAGATVATADQETPPADLLAAAKPEQSPPENAADASADSSTEMSDAQASDGAAVAFAETPDPAENEAAADETHGEEADQGTPLAHGHQWSAGSAPEQTVAASNSTLRIVAADEEPSGDGPAGDSDAGSNVPGESDLAIRIDAGDANEAAASPASNDDVARTGGAEPTQPMIWSNPPQASPIGSTEPTDQSTTLAMASPEAAVIQTGWNEPAAATPASAAGTAQAGGSAARTNQAYGYDPSYGWLRGRLEYSASQQQWKLRYIPIDGATDQFGGSVVLADGAATQGLRAGDFVTAQGRVVGASQPGRGFSPRYEVASIEPASGLK